MQLCCKTRIFVVLLKTQSKINWDGLGIGASVACAIHCALLPLIFTSLPVFGINIIENLWFEVIMVILAFAIGMYSLYHGWKKHHHRLLPLIIFVGGFIFLVLKLYFAEYENWLLLPAVAGIVTAHLVNYKACKIHNHAHAEDCNH